MTKQATIRILDEVSVFIHGLEDVHNEHFYNKYGVFAPNYFFNPKFKLGRWDGKIRYYQKTGRTFLYLLDEILPQIAKLGYKIKLDDQRSGNYASPDLIDVNVFSHIHHLDTGKPIVLRDDQVTAVNSLIQDGNGLCIAATGAGKTFMCAALVQAYDLKGIRSLTIVPDQTLIKQTKRDYVNCGLDTGEYSGTEKSLEHTHVVSTWQALKNNPKVVELFQMVIVDECHGLRGNVLQSILVDHCAKVPYRFGFTGTLPKEQSDRLAVFVAVGSVKHNICARELIDMGQLANLHIDVIQLEEDLQKQYKEFCSEVNFGKPPTYAQFKDGYFPDFSAEKSYLHRNNDRIAWIAAYIEAKRNNKKGNVLCLVDNISFGRQLVQYIPNAIFVNGQDVKKAEDRQAVYDMFKDQDDLVVIATVHIAGTGLSIRRIFNLVLVDVGKSFIRVIQAIGRGLRMADDKDSVNISDICSDLKYGKKHLKQRIDYYNEAQYPYKKHKVDYHNLMRSPIDDADE